MTKKPRICFNKKLILKKFSSFLSDLKPFITSHHPDCDYFRDHYIVLRGTKICIGCFFTSITVIIVIIIHLTIGIWSLIPKNLEFLLALIAIYSLLYFLGIFSRNKKTRIISKIVFGFLFVAVLIFVYEFPYPVESLRIAMTILVFMLMNYVVGAIRMYGISKTCGKCPENDNFPLCSGFNSIIEKLKRDGFIRLCGDQ